MLKRIPFLLGLIFITVTTHRVASFFGNDVWAWITAIGMTCGVYISAYLIELKKTRKAAVYSLLFLAICDAGFNTTEILKWSVEVGRWNFVLAFSEDFSIYIYRISDPIYGIFPTIAAALMAWLSKNVEATITYRKGDWKEKFVAGIINWFTGTLPEASAKKEVISEDVPEAAVTLPEWLPVVPKTKEEFRQLYRQGTIQIPDDVTSAQLAEYLPVGERSARNWVTDAKNGHTHPD